MVSVLSIPQERPCRTCRRTQQSGTAGGHDLTRSELRVLLAHCSVLYGAGPAMGLDNRSSVKKTSDQVDGGIPWRRATAACPRGCCTPVFAAASNAENMFERKIMRNRTHLTGKNDQLTHHLLTKRTTQARPSGPTRASLPMQPIDLRIDSLIPVPETVKATSVR